MSVDEIGDCSRAFEEPQPQNHKVYFFMHWRISALAVMALLANYSDHLRQLRIK